MNQQIQHLSGRSSTESAQVIAISNGNQLERKSSMALNLAICLSNLGKRVCVFDANENQPEQKLLFENSTSKSKPNSRTLNDLMSGEISVNELIYQGPAGIKVIPPSTGIAEYSTLDAEQRQYLLLAITQLQHDYDYLMIDTAAGINDSTISFLLGSGSIVITITPDATSLTEAFSLLKGIKQRVFQQPVRVIVNLVAGEVEAKQIIARLSITVRKYLGLQCGGLSFFIIDDHMLNVMSQSRLVMIEYPHSLPSQCLKNVALRLAESGQPESMMYSNQLAGVSTNKGIHEQPDMDHFDNDPGWLTEALYSVQTGPVDLIDPIMTKLNEVWQQRKNLLSESHPHPNVFELELLRLKTAIHFASKIRKDDKEVEN